MIGLGNMGGGMAVTLARAGFAVHGFDSAPQSVARFVDTAVRCESDIATLMAQVDVVILSLPTSAIVERVVLGEDGVLAHGRPGQTVIDTTTAEPDSTRKLAQALEVAGLAFIDAPVSGGSAGANEGTLTMMLGGDAAAISKMDGVLDALSAKRVHVGPIGAGHTAKLLNNLLCGAHLILAGEAARVARSAGLDLEQIFAGINAGSGRSAATEVNYPRWIFPQAFDSGFTMKLMRKDIGLAMGLLTATGAAQMPLSRAAGRLWQDSATWLDDALDFNHITDDPPEAHD